MPGKSYWIFALLLYASVFFAQAHNKYEADLTFDTTSPATIVAQSMTYFFKLEEIAKPYCQKYSYVMPIVCGKCKKHTLSLGEFSGNLLDLLLDNANNKEMIAKIAPIFDNFLKLLTQPDITESTMVDSVLKEMKKINYLCNSCNSISWEKCNF